MSQSNRKGRAMGERTPLTREELLDALKTLQEKFPKGSRIDLGDLRMVRFDDAIEVYASSVRIHIANESDA